MSLTNEIEIIKNTLDHQLDQQEALINDMRAREERLRKMQEEQEQ